MVFNVLSLNVGGLNKTIKRRQIFCWLHQQKSDVVFLQETYSSVQNLKLWEAEWGGKMIGSHGTNHSRGVMTLFKSKLAVNIEQIISHKNGRCILAEASVEGEKFVFLNIYTPNDQTQQVQFLFFFFFFFPHVLLPFENKEVFTRLSVYSIYICELLLFIKLYSYL